MNILQKGEKIGYAHRQFFKTEGGYRIVEEVLMEVKAMGLTQEIGVKTMGNFHRNLTLSSFDFEMKSSLFRFKSRGILQGNVLTLFSGVPGHEQRTDLTLDREIHLLIGLLQVFSNENLREGESRIYEVFDPASSTHRPIKVTLLGEEPIFIGGGQERAQKVKINFLGFSQYAWIGKGGDVLREEGILGLRLEKVTKKEALGKRIKPPLEDLGEMVSIPANQILLDPFSLKGIRLRLEGFDEESFFLNGGRQSLSGKVLTVWREPIPQTSPRKLDHNTPLKLDEHLKPTPFIQADHPEIQKEVRRIISSQDSEIVKAHKLVEWVYKNIKKRPVLSIPNALHTLRNRMGDCNDHAVLLAALARAGGIPSEVEAGLVYHQGRFYYHAWNVLYLGDWVTADGAMGQFPADVTHLRLVRGMEHQVDLLKVIQKARLEILTVFKND
ncbi:MAG: transglutaminase-like domain-containing protein [Thermodesulfobacteriota bacterium]